MPIIQEKLIPDNIVFYGLLIDLLLSKIEKEKGFWRPLLGGKSVRSGKSNSWKEDMSSSILDALVERNYKMMKYFNYI